MKLLFNLGRIAITDGARIALIRANQCDYLFFVRHQTGDWGDILPDQLEKNEAALGGNGHLVSIYSTAKHDRLVVDSQFELPGEAIETTISLLNEKNSP